MIKINLDKTSHSIKPTGVEIGAIQNKIHQTHEVTVQELHEVLTAGGSMKMAALTGGAKDINWTSQQVFALDFDNGEKEQAKYGLITPQDIVARCRLYGVEPAFYYASFSNMTEKDNFVPKFRVVFISDIEITDVRVRSAYMFALMRMFPECDPSCKDLSRLMFGGKALPMEEVSINYEATVSLTGLVGSMSAFIADTDKNNHYAREMKNYCALTAINAVNNLPDIKEVDANSNFGVMTTHSINIIIEQREESPKMITIDFNMSEADYRTSAISTETKKKAVKQKITTTKIKAQRLTENFNFDELESNCQLYREFVGGERWCYHDEVFGIATNLWRFNTGQTRMIDAITSNESYVDAPNKINTITNCSASQYEPKRCENFCPYRGECQNAGLNMIHAVDNKRQQIRQLEELKLEKLEIVYAIVEEVITERHYTTATDLAVIVGPTGVGKTTMICNLASKDPMSFNNTLLAFPTNKLALEVSEKLKPYLPTLLTVVRPTISDKAVEAEYVAYQQAGLFKEANDCLEAYVKVTSDTKEAIEISNFLSASSEMRVTNRPIICTHKRMFNVGNPNIAHYIIDEDIMQTAVQNITMTDAVLGDIRCMLNVCINLKLKGLEQTFSNFLSFIDEVQTDTTNTVIENKYILGTIDSKDFRKVLKEYKPRTNVRDAISVVAAVRSSIGIITGYKRNNLPNKKITVLSATANETVYKNVFKDREVKFSDAGLAETAGEVILHNAGMSRSHLKEDKNYKKALAKITQEADGIDNMITFKKYADKFSKDGYNVITNFGATTGIDAYKGQDLIVLGTPHLNTDAYLLLAHASGVREKININMEYVNVKRNGFEFTFSTHNSRDLSPAGDLIREIQFYLIESELIQAVGRARVLRENCTVHLFTNLPLRGCKLYK